MKPLPQLPPRNQVSHKGDFGRALCIGGSRGMAGAIALTGMATLRAGAGLVSLGVPDCCLETVAAFEPCAMTIPLPADDRGRLSLAARDAIWAAAASATCVAVGPGLGRSEDLTELVGLMFRDLPRPLVVDADGLNALANRPGSMKSAGGPRILTPHPGEFARLASIERLSESDRSRLAAEKAAALSAVIVLKGHQTVISDGRETFLNETGNPGMATAGAGDVLTGVITALVCQGLSPLDAARLGAHVHGCAGDIAAKEIGPVGIVARDLITYLPRALANL